MDFNLNSKTWQKFVEIIEQYLQQNQLTNTPVLTYESAHTLQEKLNLALGEIGESREAILNEIKLYLKYSPNTLHPQFSNQLNAGINFEGFLAEIITALTNTTMSTYEVSPVATLMENKLIEELNRLLGFQNGDGAMVTGGSNANLMALHLARHQKIANVRNAGNGSTAMQVYVSKAAHYSMKKAMVLLGLGLDNLIAIETSDEGVMCAADLEVQIQKTLSEKKIPLMICSTAGTTVFGAFDDIEANTQIAKKYGVWHHVDAAWGGVCLFSKQLKVKLRGVNQVDSFTFDAHKMLGTGLITSFILVNHPNALMSANAGGGSFYLFHDYENEQFDLGKKSLQCGRKVDSLKLWLTWKSHGSEGLGRLVDEQYQKQVYFTNLIKNHPRFKLVHTPSFLNTCFQVIPENKAIDINQFNLELRYKVVQSGQLMINYSTSFEGTIFFRQVFANHNTSYQQLDKMLEILLSHI